MAKYILVAFLALWVFFTVAAALGWDAKWDEMAHRKESPK